MGNTFSTSDEMAEAAEIVRREKEMKEANEIRMRREAILREQTERTEKERIAKAIAEREKAQKAEIEREIKEAAAANLKITRGKVAAYNEVKAAGERKLVELSKQIDEEIQKAIEEKKKEGVQKVTDGKENLEKDKVKLVEQKKKITEEINTLTETKENMLIARQGVKKELEEKEEAQIEEHKAQLEKVREETFQAVEEGEKKINQELEKHKQFQKQITMKSQELLNIKMEQSYALIDADSKERAYEDFRRRAGRLRYLLTIYLRNFREQEKDLISTRDQINLGIPVTNTPDLTYVSSSLNDLYEALQNFNCDEAIETSRYEKLRDELEKLVNELSSNQSQIGSRISSYKGACTVQPSPQPTREVTPEPEKTRLVSMTYSEDEEFDVLGTNSSKSSQLTPPQSLNLPNSVTIVPESASSNFSIAEHFEKNQTLTTTISKLMLEFNVPASRLFEEQLSIQFKQLSTRSTANTLQIMDGAQNTSPPAALEYSPSEKKGNSPS